MLLPKCAEAGEPAKYRPITMSDIVVRCFHRILAQRMEIHLPFSTRQKAFRAGDGVADSVWFIQAVIKHHQDNLRPLNVAFVDVKKAFDCFSPVNSGAGGPSGGTTSILRVYLRAV